MKIKTVVTLLLTVVLSGCSSTYILNGKNVGGRESYLKAVDEFTTTMGATVQPLPKPVTARRLIVAIPSTATLQAGSNANYLKLTQNPTPPMVAEQFEVLAIGVHKMQRAFFEIAQNRNIYPGVRLVLTDTMTPSIEASPQEDVLSYYETNPQASTWYYQTAKHGKQVFAFDASVTGAARVQSFLDALQLQAVKD